MEETTQTLRALLLYNWKAPGGDSTVVQLMLGIDRMEGPFLLLERFHAILEDLWSGEEVLQTWKNAANKVLYKRADRSNCKITTAGGSRFSLTSARSC